MCLMNSHNLLRDLIVSCPQLAHALAEGKHIWGETFRVRVGVGSAVRMASAVKDLVSDRCCEGKVL